MGSSTSVKEHLELHLQRTHDKRVADFRQFQQMLEQVDAEGAETSATKVGLLSIRFGQVLLDMASLRDPTAYVIMANVLQSLKPGFEWPIVLVTDKQRLEDALKKADRWNNHRHTLTALYQFLELVSEDQRLAGLSWMGFASMHPSIDTEHLNVFKTSMFPALPPDALVPATQLGVPAIGKMTETLRRLVQ